MNRARMKYLLAAMALVILTAAATPASALTREEILDRAQRWVSLEVPYSQVSNFESYRQDCSGMMSMAWKLGYSYSSRTLAPLGVEISREELQPGDMMLEYDYHAAVFYKWANGDHTWYWAMEQSGTVGHAVCRLTKYPYWDHQNFHAYRPKVYDEVNDYNRFIIPVAGPSRYSTAARASRVAYGSDTATSAVVCSGENWPDALGGSALAGVLDAPILLTKRDSLHDSVAAEIERLHVSHVVIVGGELAVSKTVAAALRAIPSVTSVERLGGIDRYATAALVASATVSAQLDADLPYDGGAYVATGKSFPDALGAAAVAAHTGRPIVLAKPSTLTSASSDVLEQIGATQVWIAGGTEALGSEVATQLVDMGIEKPRRFAGANRYETAYLLAKHGVGEGLTWEGLAVATGEGFADALAGGVMQARRGSVLLLTKTGCLERAPDRAIREDAEDMEAVIVLGGETAVSPLARRQIRWILDEP